MRAVYKHLYSHIHNQKYTAGELFNAEVNVLFSEQLYQAICAAENWPNYLALESKKHLVSKYFQVASYETDTL